MLSVALSRVFSVTGFRCISPVVVAEGVEYFGEYACWLVLVAPD